MTLISRLAKLPVLAFLLCTGTAVVQAIEFPPDPYTYTWYELAYGAAMGEVMVKLERDPEPDKDR